MLHPNITQIACFGASLLAAFHSPAVRHDPPARFGVYYSGPACPTSPIDRTFSQFQVNVAPTLEVVRGLLVAADDGGAMLAEGRSAPIQLLTNASRAEWLLSYPLIQDEVGVVGRPILRPDCSVARDALYVEALFPPLLLSGSIDTRVDLDRRGAEDPLQAAVRSYRHRFGGRAALPSANRPAPGPRRAPDLVETLFSIEEARAEEPWRARLVGTDEPLPRESSIEIYLSGSDGSTGMFGHIAVGGAGMVYNVYPKGSDRGAPGPVPAADYLFNAQRGQALRRPTWVLRLEGLPADLVARFQAKLQQEVLDIEDGRIPYHPTMNNCTIVSLKALAELGFKVPAARYFTRRFPRPAFERILRRLPGMVDAGKLPARRVELAFVPQVPTRISSGGAPNRPLRDRARIY